MLIRVHGAWDGWRHAEVRLRDLQIIHWLQPERAPQRLLHGYVLCSGITAGDIPHDCGALKPRTHCSSASSSDNTPSVYVELARRADTAATACASLATETLDPVRERNGAPVRLIPMRIRGGIL
jgi:hypothetical protein